MLAGDDKDATRSELGSGSSAAAVLAEARAGVDAHVGGRLRACEELRELALVIATNWTGRPMEPEAGVDRPIALLFARTSGTYWATVELLRMAFGPQAAMLTRALFEEMVDMHYIAVEPARAVDRLPMYHQHFDMLMADALRKHPRLMGRPGHAQRVRPSAEARARAAYSVCIEKGWSGRSIHQRVEAIAHRWLDPADRKHLDFFLGVIHRVHNQTLHVTGASLSAVMRGADERGLHVSFSPGPEQVKETTFAAFWIYSQSVRMVLDAVRLSRRDAGDLRRMYSDACARSCRPRREVPGSAPETPRRASRQPPSPACRPRSTPSHRLLAEEPAEPATASSPTTTDPTRLIVGPTPALSGGRRLRGCVGSVGYWTGDHSTARLVFLPTLLEETARRVNEPPTVPTR